MAKFVEYRDQFKWNKQLMEDDWNDGQAWVVKTTTKAVDCVSTQTMTGPALGFQRLK